MPEVQRRDQPPVTRYSPRFGFPHSGSLLYSAPIDPVSTIDYQFCMGRQRKSREFNVVIERDSEGFYVATVPALRGCHSQARTLDQLTKRIREAIELCLEVDGSDFETPDFVGVQRVAV
jgi:predicted RNase H-like HicB family nuclease